MRESELMDLDFLDGLIQELCKAPSEGGVSPIARLLIMGVPRGAVLSLRSRNCASFLLLNSLVLTVVDDVGSIHFVGLRQSRGGQTRTEDLLLLACTGFDQFVGAGNAGLLDGISLPAPGKGAVIGFLQANLRLRAINIGQALRRMWTLELAEQFDEYFAVKPHTAFRLRNGTLVHGILDTSTLWGNPGKASAAANLLADNVAESLADTLITFNDNGAAIAAEIQRILAIPTLVVLDSNSSANWHLDQLRGTCTIVIDVLYPGDENAGYIQDVVHGLRSVGQIVTAIVAVVDYRATSLPLYGVRVSTALHHPMHHTVDLVADSIEHVFGRPEQFRVERIPSNNPDPQPEPKYAVKYAEIELSSDFWQNVSSLGVVSPIPTGKEERNVVFYEDNERLIRHPRLRKYARSFIANFVGHRLRQRVDVILVPTHAVGAVLASWARAELRRDPLIIAVPQRQYGGKVEPSVTDYQRWLAAVERLSGQLNRRPRVLILDDSVLSGGSLFTMLGVAHRLGLKVTGIAVLLNRLSAELSAALDSFAPPFAYLYRLHMPMLTRDDEPASIIDKKNDVLSVEARSAFAHRWMRSHREESLPFGLTRDAPSSIDFSPNWPLSIIAETKFESGTVDHVVRSLLFHNDPSILSFHARLAATYNFLGALARDGGWWAVLRSLIDHPHTDANGYASALAYVRRSIGLVSLALRTDLSKGSQELEDFCSGIINDCLDGADLPFPLVTDSFVAMGLTQSSRLIMQTSAPTGASIFERVIRLALDGNPVALSLLAPLGWYRSALLLGLQADPLPIQMKHSFVALLDTAADNEPGNAVRALDVLDPDWLAEPPAWNGSVLLERLMQKEGDSSGAYAYLKYAPGYTLTLLAIRRVCNCQSVLLYAKSKRDSHYFLRAQEGPLGRSALPSDVPEYLCANEGTNSLQLRAAMADRLPTVSLSADDLKAVDKLTGSASPHRWLVGVPVLGNHAIDYYCVLGFSTSSHSLRMIQSVLSYWQRVEPLLRDILPSLHGQYVESSATWNALVQSVRTVHSSAGQRKDERPELFERRQRVERAILTADLEEMVAHTVEMYALPVVSLHVLRELLMDRAEGILGHLGGQSIFVPLVGDQQNGHEGQEQLGNDITYWPVRYAPIRHSKRHLFFAAHTGIIRYVYFEALKNALSYHLSDIEISLALEESAEEGGVRMGEVSLTISNDIHPMAGISEQAVTRGVVAAQMAALAVRGRFTSERIGNRWVAVLTIPAHLVPLALEELVNGR